MVHIRPSLSILIPVTVTITLTLALAACGQTEQIPAGFNKPTDSCEPQASRTRFNVRLKSGELKTVHAHSQKDFLQNYFAKHQQQIAYAEPDYFVHSNEIKAQAVDEVTYADNWGVFRVDPTPYWSKGFRGQNVAVAIVDSGMDLTHPQLKKQILINQGEVGADSSGKEKATNGLDDDDNGFIDDAYGFDFTRTQKLAGDYNVHGTHVAGIIAAAHNDTTPKSGDYVQGIAPQAKVLPLAFLDESGGGLISDGVRAIQYAVQRGVQVINASWGGEMCSQTLRDTIESLEQSHVVFVNAAGNESLNVDRIPMFPASFNLPAQITVGATGDYDSLAQFSNYGVQNVHIFAPGAYITSTIPNGNSKVPNGKMGVLSGTSMAAPFVAGAAALYISAHPDATPGEIREYLGQTGYHHPSYLNRYQARLKFQNPDVN